MPHQWCGCYAAILMLCFWIKVEFLLVLVLCRATLLRGQCSHHCTSLSLWLVAFTPNQCSYCVNLRKDDHYDLTLTCSCWDQSDGTCREECRIKVCGWFISHFFGSFCAGVLLLNSPEKYHYLKQSGCYGDPSINDKEDFNNVMVCPL